MQTEKELLEEEINKGKILHICSACGQILLWQLYKECPLCKRPIVFTIQSKDGNE